MIIFILLLTDNTITKSEPFSTVENIQIQRENSFFKRLHSFIIFGEQKRALLEEITFLACLYHNSVTNAPIA